MLKVIVVDDEPLARKGMVIRLAEFPALNIVAECSNGHDAIEKIKQHQPDVVFLDVEMPGMDGFSVVKQLQAEQQSLPYIIFVTAYDHYALDAFDVNALDYVLKPVEPQRLKQAVDKLLLQHAPQEPLNSKGRYPDTISIKDSGEITRVPVADIDWVDAAGDYMCIHTNDGQTHILRRTMKELEQELDPALFIRVHRSAIVNVNTIAKLLMLANGEHQLMLTNGQSVKVSRSYKDRVKQVFSQ